MKEVQKQAIVRCTFLNYTLFKVLFYHQVLQMAMILFFLTSNAVAGRAYLMSKVSAKRCVNADITSFLNTLTGYQENK